MSSSDRKRVREANGDFAAALTDATAGFSDVDMDAFDDEPATATTQYRTPTRRPPRMLPHVPFYPRLGAEEFDDESDFVKRGTGTVGDKRT